MEMMVEPVSQKQKPTLYTDMYLVAYK